MRQQGKVVMTASTPADDGDSVDALLAASPEPLAKKPLSPALLARVFHQPSLIYFNAVAEHLSVREASRRLNTAPSAVTRQVAHLENVLGLALFLREGRRLRLAPAGEVLYRHTRSLTSPLVAAIAELDMLRGLKSGTVRIASAESVGLTFLPPLIAVFGAHYPGLHLNISVASSTEVVDHVANGRADIGLAFITKAASGVEIASRRDVPIGALMHADHPLAKERQITLAACVVHPFAVATPHISIRDVIEPFLQRSALSHLPFVEVDSIRMLVELACTGRYVSIMTAIGAERELADGRLVFRPLEDSRLPRNRFGLILKAGASLNYAAAVFFEHAKQQLDAAVFPG
jgi:DNA-binding transcriptional LysR family regulator